MHSLLILIFAALSGPGIQRAPLLAIRNVAVVDVERGVVRPHMTVVIGDGRIIAVGKSWRSRIPDGAQVIDGTNRFLIPGLWDMHVHALFDEVPEKFFPLFLAYGVTSIRDMGTDRSPAGIAALKSSGPRIHAAGPWVDGPHPVNPGSIAVSNASDARAAVDSLVAQGVDFIKVYSLLPRDAYVAIADEAHRKGIPFAGHVPETVTAWEASEAGQRSIEHLYGVLRACSSDEASMLEEMTHRMADADAATSAVPLLISQSLHAIDTFDAGKAAMLAEVFKRNRTALDPTLIWHRTRARTADDAFLADPRTRQIPDWMGEVWANRMAGRRKSETPADIAARKRLLDRYMMLTRFFAERGVVVLAGTDTGEPYCFPGSSLHEELALLVEAGLSPARALRAATSDAAAFMGERDLGTIAAGKRADVVLLDANPLVDIHNTTKIRTVISRGVITGGR